MKSREAVLMAGFILMASFLQAQERDPDPLGALAGSWAGEGMLMGRPARPTMTWERVLGGQFMRLAYRSEMTTAEGQTRSFEGHAYYKSVALGKLEGVWFDSQGARHPITASFAEGTLTATWGTEQTTLGQTVYRLLDANRLEVVDTIRNQEGAWREFGRSVLSRK